jgi:phosphoribosylformylglycinamidine synthase subunit PurS
VRYEVHAEITLKPTVMDAQGTTIEKALHKMGHANVDHVRIGKVVTMEIEAARPEDARVVAEDMCRELLANPIIEQYHVTIVNKEAAA